MDHASKKNNMHRRTPGWLIQRIRDFATIGLDPCASPNPKHHFARSNWYRDGLTLDWAVRKSNGIVYCNPPYGTHIRKWIPKIVEEAARGCEIVALVPGRLGTKWYRMCRETSYAMCELDGRLRFDDGKDPAMFASVLFYWGNYPEKFVDVFEDLGLCFR